MVSDTRMHRPRVLAIDAGGTMTDSFIVDEQGAFVVGKAQTTPQDESIGFMSSAADALRQWNMAPEDGFPQIAAAVFGGTAMLNRVLTRSGLKVGLIVTAGQEDYLRLERGKQTFLSFSYGDRLHVATHYHNEPLVPRNRVYGVRGRIDLNGEEVIPLLEDEVREATAGLLAAGSKRSSSITCSHTAIQATSYARSRSSTRRSGMPASTDRCPFSPRRSCIPSAATCRG